MADNYLERKMEQLRSQRTSGGIKSQLNRVGLGWTLPKLRVVVVGDSTSLSIAVARAYVAAGCRVTLIERENDAAKKLAREGVRFSIADSMADIDVKNAIAETFKEWREIDLVIFCGSGVHLDSVRESMHAHYSRFPRISEYPPRFIFLIRSPEEIDTVSEKMSVKSYIPVISYNRIILTTATGTEIRPAKGDDVARLCLFLSLPDSDFIHKADISVSYAES